MDEHAVAEFPRAFCAVVWHPDALAPLRELQDSVRAAHADAPLTWLAADDLHLTLRFFGDVTSAVHARLGAAVTALAGMTRVSRLELQRLETWPTIRPRVLVARFRAEPTLVRLQADLEREARALGLAPELRRFQPHVTLARAASGWNGGLARIKLAPLSLPADRLGLLHRAPRGPQRYVEALQCRLTPVPEDR